MWFVLAFPPVTIPWGVRFPINCPRCGGPSIFHVHERVTKTLPYVASDQIGPPQVTAYNTVRFRCSGCGHTKTSDIPIDLRGSRVPAHLRSRVLAWYALGFLPSQVVRWFNDPRVGWQLSRATVYRILQKYGNDELRELHRSNRIRKRRSWRRGKKFDFYHGSDSPAFEDAFAAALMSPAKIAKESSPFAAGVVVVRAVVMVFQARGDAAMTRTIDWIERDLLQYGHAGVLRYRRLAHLMRDFHSTDDLRETDTPGATLLFREIEAPLDKAAAFVRDAVRFALRTIELEQSRHRSPETTTWSNKWSYLEFRELEFDDVYDR